MSIIRSDHDQPDVPTASGSGTRHTPALSQVVRPLVMRLHFYAGVFIAPFLIVAAISGGLYAIAPTAEQWVYRDVLHTDSTGPSAPLAEQVEVAQGVVPDLEVAAVRPAVEAGQTTRVLFSDPSLGPSERMAVFIDPVTATSQGTEVAYGSSGSLPMRTWISQLHRNLHLGEPGRIYSELAASWLWVIALGGLALWIIRYRKLKRNTGSAALLTVDRKSKGRNRTLNWHGAVGAWIVIGLVFLSATGLTWSRFAGENIGELRQSLSWTTPALNSSLDPAAAPADTGHHDHGGGGPEAVPADQQIVTRNVTDVGQVLSTARAAGVTGAVEMTIPADADTAMVVSQVRTPWQLETNSVAIDPATGTIIDESRFSEWPLAAKLTSWGIALHMGLLFGLANQVVLLAIAIGLVSLGIRGYLMWWKRRPTRSRRTGLGLPTAPRRGALRTIHPAAAVVVVLTAAAVGWFIPLLGLSVLAFVVIDAAIGLYQRSADRRTITAAARPHTTTSSSSSSKGA